MMRREDLRVPCEHGRYDEHPPPLSMETMLHKMTCPGGRTLTDAELAELIESEGYVKADAETYVNEVMRLAKKYGWFRPLDSTQGSFRAAAPNGEVWEIPERVLTSAGWVKRPDCGECKGRGSRTHAPHLGCPDNLPCPSCGGTGKERGVFVSRTQLESWLADSDKQHDLEASFERLLAVLEGETDE